MKIKKLIFFATAILVTLSSTAFIQTEAEVPETPKVGNLDFAKFLSHFEKVEMPYNMGLKELGEFKNAKVATITRSGKKSKAKRRSPARDLEKYIPELNFGKLSRMGPPEVQPVARFYPSEKMIAVIYTVKRHFGMKGQFDFKMAIFDLKGNKINADGLDNRRANVFDLGRVATENTSTFRDMELITVWNILHWENSIIPFS